MPYALLLSRDIKREPDAAADGRDLDARQRASSTTTGTWRRSSTATAFSSAARCGAADRARRDIPGAVRDETEAGAAAAGQRSGPRKGADAPRALRRTEAEADSRVTAEGSKTWQHTKPISNTGRHRRMREYEHTDIEPSIASQVRDLAGDRDGALGRHRLRHVLVLRGPGASAEPRAQVYPLAVGQTKEPPTPRLQTQPFKDMYLLRAGEQEKLTSYGWVDQDARRGAHPDRRRDGVDAAATGCVRRGPRRPATVWIRSCRTRRRAGPRRRGTRDATKRSRRRQCEDIAIDVLALVLLLVAASRRRRPTCPACIRNGRDALEPDAGVLSQNVSSISGSTSGCRSTCRSRDEDGRTVKLGDYFGTQAGGAGVRVLRVPDAVHAGAQRPDRRADACSTRPSGASSTS